MNTLMMPKTSMKHLISLLSLCGFLSLNHLTTHAHPGHDHGPKVARSVYGGVIYEGKSGYAVEVVQQGQSIKLYPLYHEKDQPWEAIEPKDFTIKQAKATLPRQKNSVDVTLKAQKNFFLLDFDSKGAHRYTLDLHVEHQDKKDQISILIESNH